MKNVIQTVAATCLLALSLAPPALAANECRVRYAYAPSFGQTSIQTVDIDAGQSKTINRSSTLWVENLNGHAVRVFRTGFGSYVELGENGRDPAGGAYIGDITLQKLECLASSASAPTLQQLVEAAFQAVSNATVQYLDQLATWQNNAQQWAGRTAADWGSCPSNGAQTSYNQLKSWRNNVNASLQQAEQIKADAEAARNACNATTNNNVLCGSTYNTLPVHGWIISLNSTKNSLSVALAGMAALQCPSGCSQSAQLIVPTPNVQDGGVYEVTNPGWIDATVCTKVNLGSIGFNTAAISSGNMDQAVDVQPPTCSETANFRACTNWDLAGLLSALQRLRLVPPDAGRIELDIPTRTATVITGVETASCQQPLRVCVPGGNVTVSLNEGADLFSGGASCTNYLTVGCANPPFGLQPSTRQVERPDYARTTVRWAGLRPGSVQIDLASRDFQAFCLGAGRTGLLIPKPPVFTMNTTTVPLPFLCTQPTWASVVANP